LALVIGDTIENLQGRMGYREYLVWNAYRNKYGPLNPVRMYDQAGAIVASQINNAYGGKAKPIDFMPYAPKQEEKTDDEILEALILGGKIGR